MSGPGGPGARWEGDAPAKVNLVLRVLAREASGYHQLETVFQALELADRITLELRGDDRVELELTGAVPGELGPDQENLAVRAARGFLEAVGAGSGGGSPPPGVSIHLEKQIPHGAGLGGGSSDAAAVLRGMNELHGSPLVLEDILRVGGGLGADVPFFVTGASRALAWNRGDRLLPLPPLPAREVLVAVPRVGMATPEAYRRLAAHREEEGAQAARPGIPEVAASWERVADRAVNDFEDALFPVRPELAALKEALQEMGARPALLAGSGSAVFGVFRRAEKADRVAGEIEADFPGTRVIRTRSLG
jgi:4-diphosphocytidyl-2-C-methyl-D-erythritol kinase